MAKFKTPHFQIMAAIINRRGSNALQVAERNGVIGRMLIAQLNQLVDDLCVEYAIAIGFAI